MLLSTTMGNKKCKASSSITFILNLVYISQMTKLTCRKTTVGIVISEAYLFVLQQASSQKHWLVTRKGIRDFRYFRRYQPECV